MPAAERATRLSVMVVSAALLGGCPLVGGSSRPTITLTVTDCDVADITMTAGGTQTAVGGNQWRPVATVDVKCNGVAVNNAELKAEFWWPGGTLTMKTLPPNGRATYTRKLHADPADESYKVTIRGRGGDRQASLTFP
ncbi:MAG: hypothetical protein QNJ91_17205 [Gammaproteobacteria bacterium]|nr:hypothetical protein [Gammaproteobacteria bacterium]